MGQSPSKVVGKDDVSGPSDADLVARAGDGDRAAFALLYRRHAPALYRFALSLSRSSPVAEDVVHDVFVTLMSQLDRYDAARAPLAPYLYGIARNHVRTRLRHERRHIGLDTDVAEPRSGQDVVGDLTGAEQRSALQAAIGALPLRYREALVLCALHEMKYDEAAQVLDVPVGTVRSRLHRARQMLSERVHRAAAPAVASSWRLWRKFS